MATIVEYGGETSPEVRAEATRPKYGSQLVGYTGYIPGMKYSQGKNFAALSHMLAQCEHNHKHPAIGFGQVQPEDRFSTENIGLVEKELAKRFKVRKLFTDLPVGYSGNIPRYMYEANGLRFSRGSVKALQEYLKMQSIVNEDLKNLRCHQECSRCLEPKVCEDEITESLKNTSDRIYPCGFPSRRHPMEAHVVGHMGHVPRTRVLLETAGMDHRRETCFGLVTSDCLRKHNRLQLEHPCVDPSTSSMQPACLDPPTIYRIYMQDGMIPRYTGVVPETLFEFGKTFAESTRSVECCCHGEPNFGIHQRKKRLAGRTVESMQVIT